MTKVYFATNRKNDGTGPFGYGSAIVANDASKITYAVAEVDGIQLPDEDSGTISSIHDQTTGAFSDAVNNQIVAAGRNLLVFIHGFDNSFEDAIKRAAFNREWFADAGGSAANTTVIAFTWPSAGKVFEPGHSPDDEYKIDQTQAGKSGFHLASFFRNIDALRTEFAAAQPQGRIFLLAHSMGNHALEAGVRGWVDAHGPSDQIFNQAFLAAPDEIADTFEQPQGGGLSDLPLLCDRISIYSSRRDSVIWLSALVNENKRLGYNGPTNKSDAAKYPPVKFRLVDCTDVLDYSLLDPPDASHQYYRRSKKVREDIVACMVDRPRPAGGLIWLMTPIPATS